MAPIEQLSKYSIYRNEIKRARYTPWTRSEEVLTLFILRALFDTESKQLVTGFGFAAYNPNRSILGIIPVGGSVTYHLFTLDTNTSYSKIKLSRKSKWFSQFTISKGNSLILYII